MKNLLLLIFLLVLPGLAVGQNPKPRIDSVDLSERNVNGSEIDKKRFHGISAIEYVPAISGKAAYWILVSDQGGGKKNNKPKDTNSYSFTATSIGNLTNIVLSKPEIFFGARQVESVRYNKFLQKYFFVTEEDSGDNRVGYIENRDTNYIFSFNEKFDNKGFESLAFSPDSSMWVGFEGKEGGESCSRFYRFKYNSGMEGYSPSQRDTFKYDLPNDHTLSEILFLDKTHLLVLERYKIQKGKANPLVSKLSIAQVNENNKTIDVAKYPLLDSIPGNFEGMSIGPKENEKPMLYLITDDDFNENPKTKLIKITINIEKLIESDFIPTIACKESDKTVINPTPSTKNSTNCTDSLAKKINLDNTDKSSYSSQTTTGNDAPNQQSKYCNCKSVNCTCYPKKIACGICKFLCCTCKPKQPKNHSHSLDFTKKGLLALKNSAVVQANDLLTITVEDQKLNPNQTSLGKQFISTTEYWDKQKGEKLDNITCKIGFSLPVDVSNLINKQHNEYNARIANPKVYKFVIDKNAPIDLVWNGQEFIGNTTIPAPKNSKDTIAISLTKENNDNQFLKNVFDYHKKDYKGWADYKPTFDSLYPHFSNYASTITRLDLKRKLLEKSKKSCNCKEFNVDIKKINCEIDNLLNVIQPIQAQLCAITTIVIDSNQCWLRSWLWYTGSKPMLNPFKIISPFERNAQIERNIAADEELLKLYQNLPKDCCGDDINKIIENRKVIIAQLALEINDLKNEQENSGKRESDYKTSLKNLAQTQLFLNQSLLFVSDDETVKWMNHYNAQDNYARMNPDESLPERVYEHDQVHGIVHNLTANQKVSAKEYVKTIPLRTELDIQTDPFSEAVKIALGSKTSLSALATLLKGLVPTGLGLGLELPLSPQVGFQDNKKPKPCTLDTACLTKFYEVLPLIEWLHEQTEPPIEDIQAAYDAFKPANLTPTYHSQDVLVGESQDAKGTNQINYEIFEAGKEKAVAKGNYQTYATIKWWPFVSINYVFGSRSVSIFDNATGQFRTDTDIDNFEAIAGAKWYIKSSNLTRTHKRTKFIRDALDNSYNKERGNLFWSKTFLFLGLGMSHNFLKNYGIGAGYDISPGFSIQGGANVFFRKSYELSNGQIKHEFDIPAVRGFVGISIDPSVVTKLISLF